MRMRRRIWVVLVGGGAAAGVLAWAFAPRPVEVELAQATLGVFEMAIEEDGRTRVRERHTVSAPVAGRLRRLDLREGDPVRPGQVLAQIDPLAAPLLDERSRREQQARVATLQAALDRAVTRALAADIGVEQALNEQRRTAPLLAEGFVSPARAEAERLALQAAQRERQWAADSERMARHELAQARVALERAAGVSTMSGPFTVLAPVAGTVLQIHRTSEGVVAPGTPLLDLADIARMEVVAELLTSDAVLARPGSVVRIERWGGEGVLVGHLRRVEPAAFTKVSALGVEEQRVNALIDLGPAASEASLPPSWSPPVALGDGWRVVVRIVTRRENEALRVPVSAVFPWPAGSSVEGEAGEPPFVQGPGVAASPQAPVARAMGVFVVVGGRARLRAVQVGGRNGSQAWIHAGLRAGDTVIVYPAPTVADGVHVTSRR